MRFYTYRCTAYKDFEIFNFKLFFNFVTILLRYSKRLDLKLKSARSAARTIISLINANHYFFDNTLYGSMLKTIRTF